MTAQYTASCLKSSMRVWVGREGCVCVLGIQPLQAHVITATRPLHTTATLTDYGTEIPSHRGLHSF